VDYEKYLINKIKKKFKLNYYTFIRKEINNSKILILKRTFSGYSLFLFTKEKLREKN